ncbi:deoxyribonuclease I [bacterium]|nr:deoxyribonuclease I [bacterium]
MMAESDRGNPIQLTAVVLLLVGGGWYFLHHYRIDGLDEVSVSSKQGDKSSEQYISYTDVPSFVESPDPASESAPYQRVVAADFSVAEQADLDSFTTATTAPNIGGLKIASWALDGFGPTKLANPAARQNVARVVRQFDVIALQQIASIERDLIPRLVEAINQSGGRYDFVVGPPTGPVDRPEQLAFIFDTARVVVDRRQTYTLDDPDNQMTFDPLVAWFRAAQGVSGQAWTFSFVNIRIDLARAPNEVALLPKIMQAIRGDGRREDDLVIAGLLQADDAYLLPALASKSVKATVRNRPTDIFGRYQTSNLLLDTNSTTEYMGRGGVFDYLGTFNLNLAEAETVTSHLPVYGEFSATEGTAY